MKPIRPVDNYLEDRGYPVPEDVDPGRRAALGRLLGGAVAGGVALLGGGASARGGAAAVGKGRGYHAVHFGFQPTIRKRACRLWINSVLVQSKDRRLIAFVKDGKERGGIDGVLRKILAAATCADFTDQRRLVQLQRRLGTALAARYRVRRKRTTRRPLITLYQGPRRPKRPRPPLPGVPPHP